MKKTLLLSAGLFLMPVIVFAQSFNRTLYDIFGSIQKIINLAIPLLISAAVIVLLFGILKLILKGNNEKAKEEARGTIILGVIGIFVMVSIWGLVNILVNTLNLDYEAPSRNIQNLVDVPMGDFYPTDPTCPPSSPYRYGGTCQDCPEGQLKDQVTGQCKVQGQN